MTAGLRDLVPILCDLATSLGAADELEALAALRRKQDSGGFLDARELYRVDALHSRLISLDAQARKNRPALEKKP